MKQISLSLSLHPPLPPSISLSLSYAHTQTHVHTQSSLSAPPLPHTSEQAAGGSAIKSRCNFTRLFSPHSSSLVSAKQAHSVGRQLQGRNILVLALKASASQRNCSCSCFILWSNTRGIAGERVFPFCHLHVWLLHRF